MKAAVVIAADGAWSQVRKSMLDQVRNFDYAQHFLPYGYKELVIPASGTGGFLMEKNALHIWPRKQFMLIALPNLGGSFTCTLFLPYEGAESFTALHDEASLADFFRRHFPDAAALMPTLKADFSHNPTGSMVTVKCAPWRVSDRALLLGDAAHAIVPFFGQGMNCGFEDCALLGALLEGGKDPDWEMIFSAVERERKPNADAIADMALENFTEMRATVADPMFQLKKEVGFELERRYPDRFIPRYAMVVFHPEISYAQAQARGKAQDAILDQLCASITSVDQVDWEEADRLISRM